MMFRKYDANCRLGSVAGVLRKSLVCGVLLAGSFGSSPASAAMPESFGVRNTGDLVAICSSSPDDPGSHAAVGFCHGYVVGVYRTLEEIQEARPWARFFCMPLGASTRTETINALVLWASEKPNEMSKPPIEGIADYLTATYPCSRAGASAKAANRGDAR